MGLLGDIADTVGDVASAGADAIGLDPVAEGIDATQEALGGTSEFDFGTSGGGEPQGSGGDSVPEGVSSSGTMNLPGLPPVGGQFGIGSPQPPGPGAPSQNGSQNGTATMENGSMNGAMGGAMSGALAQGFGQGLMMEMLEDSINSKSGRAVLEAMTSGALQRGVIQQPQRVETPRGPRHYSPPGYRTVEVNDQKVAVFKPLARALNLLPGGSRTMREKLDDAAREYLSAKSDFEDLAPKLGLKTSERKSGPRR